MRFYRCLGFDHAILCFSAWEVTGRFLAGESQLFLGFFESRLEDDARKLITRLSTKPGPSAALVLNTETLASCRGLLHTRFSNRFSSHGIHTPRRRESWISTPVKFRRIFSTAELMPY